MAADNTFQMSMSFDPNMEVLTREMIGKTLEGMVEGINEGLVIFENKQIKAYGLNSNPSRPGGSKYIRTFRLRRSSTIAKARLQGTLVTGGWGINKNIAPYGPLVLGEEADQSGVHRGRWMSIEDVTKATEADRIRALDKAVERRVNEVP